jgi:TPR repeat protein
MEKLDEILIKSLNIKNNKEIDYLLDKIKDVKYQQYIYNFYINNILESMALFFIGVFYDYGHFVEKNYKIALEYYKKSTDLDNSYAFNNIGNLYCHGYFVEQNYKIALEYYQKSADLSNSHAFNNIGNLYCHGYGINQDYKIGLEYYQKSANLNNSYAFYNIGTLYENRCSIDKKYKIALEYYQKNANLNNCSIFYNVKKDHKIALEYYQKSANLNNSYALNKIAYIYKNGYGVKINIFKALKCYTINIKINKDLNAKYNLNRLTLIYKKDIHNKNLKLKIVINNLKNKFNKLNKECILLKSLPGEEIYHLAMQDFNLFNKN